MTAVKRRSSLDPIEKKVADTLLQTSKTLKIGGLEYDVAPPTIATLAMASREITKLPKVDIKPDENIAFKALNFAKDAEISTRVIAILILGAKSIVEQEKRLEKDSFLKRSRKQSTTLDFLADEMRYNATPRELMSAFSTLLNMMQLGDFFAFTASLSKVNILTPKTTAVTTPSGH